MVVRNLRKARKKWAHLTSILGREGSITRVSRTLFKAVIQNRVAQQIMGRQPHQILGRIWDYPSLEETMQEAVLKEVKAYILRRPNMGVQYIVMQPILDLC